MSVLSDLLGKVIEKVVAGGGPSTSAGTGTSQKKDGLLQQLLSKMLSKLTLSMLSERLKKQGLGRILESWLSQGQNLPIDRAQVNKLVGGDEIQALAQEYNVAPEAVEQLIADHLPQIVDQLSPDGRLPEEK